MPTYSYLCSECQHRFDTVQRISEDPLRECPACREPALVRQVSPVGFALKGSGWYVTDFRDKGKAKKSEGESAGTGTAEGASTPAAASSASAATSTSASSKGDAKTAASSD
ncbi:MAG TPA: zinc ribbon domain-containing protein [Gammaproteobacteria bacterium]|nr:zinc ribbon domain-containing protein [Gammaproteobacteria bacterium]